MKPSPIISDYQELSELLSQEHQGKRVVCTIGSWDILHRGHIEYLKKAKDLGDILVVGVDSDIAYQRYKKKSSMFPQEDRQIIVSTLKYVDYVALIEDVDNEGEWEMKLVKSIKPDIFLCNYQTFPSEQREKLAEICRIEIVNFYSPQSSSSSVVIAEQMKAIVLKEKQIRVRMRVGAFLLLQILLSLSILTTITMVFLNGFKITTLPQGVLYLLIGKTLPEIGSMMYIVVKHLFPTRAE